MVDDGLLDQINGQVRHVADLLLSASAQEVPVAFAGATFGFDVDESGCPALTGASVAEQCPLEVVHQDAVPLALGTTCVEDVLYPLEQLLPDDCGMSSRIFLAFVDDVAQVVRVREHLVQRRGGNGTFAWMARCAAAGQPEIGHRRFEPVNAVLASGVQLECAQHQGGSLFIELDGVNLSAFDLDAGVAVAKLCHPDSATLDRLVAHLEPNVFTGQLVLDVVEDVGHRLHSFGEDAVTEVFAGGDKLDAELVEQAFSDGGVDVVAEGAGAGVDDDVLDVRVLFEVFDQVLELAAFVDSLGRDAGIEELLDDACGEIRCFAVDVITLCGNGISVTVDVVGGVELLLAGDAQVGNSEVERVNRGEIYRSGFHAVAPPVVSEASWLWWLPVARMTSTPSCWNRLRSCSAVVTLREKRCGPGKIADRTSGCRSR
nr:hypothetical protein [Nocardia wallacei]